MSVRTWLRRNLASEIFLSFVSLTILGIGARYYFRLTAPDGAQTHFDRVLSLLLASVAFIFVLFSVIRHYLSRALVMRTIERAKATLKGEPTDGTERSPTAEWVELEQWLQNIHRELTQTSETLTREQEGVAAIMSAVSAPILAVGREGDVLYFNSDFAMMCGRTILQSSPLTLEKLFPAPEFARTFKKVLESGKPASATSTLPIGDEAVPRYFSFKVAPVQKQRGGGVYGAIGIFHDITELKKAEQIRIEFVQNVSHELRTPLTSIKGYTDTLAQDIKNGELSVVDQCLERISRNSERLLNLVNDILDLSSLESNTADLRKQIVSTREVTEHALHQLEERRKAKQHDITMNFHVDSVPGDSRRIEQVILNLVENAIKYIPAGKQIDITWDEDRRGSIVLRVRDNGPGISGTDQDRLFERFYRVDKARSRDSGGTGLGLAIVKHIMIRHGGTVDVRSEIGIGTEFTCTFPRL